MRDLARTLRDDVARWRAASLAAVTLLLFLAGCGGVPLQTAVDGASVIDQDEANRLIVTRVRFENPSTDQASLNIFRYRVSAGGEAFTGERMALRTIPPRTTVIVDLPAVLPRDTGDTIDVSGTVDYQSPRTVDMILYRIGFYRPSASFSGRATITSG